MPSVTSDSRKRLGRGWVHVHGPTPKSRKTSGDSASNAIRCYYAVRNGRYHKNVILFDAEELSKEVEGFTGAEYNVFFSIGMAANYIDEARGLEPSYPKKKDATSTPASARAVNFAPAPATTPRAAPITPVLNGATATGTQLSTHATPTSQSPPSRRATQPARKLPTSAALVATTTAPTATPAATANSSTLKKDTILTGTTESTPNRNGGEAVTSVDSVDSDTDLNTRNDDEDLMMGTLPHPDEEEQNQTTIRRNPSRSVRSDATTYSEEPTNTGASKLTQAQMNRLEGWDDMYERLLIYERDHGHVEVSRSEDKELAKWLDEQQLDYMIMKRNELIPDQSKHAFCCLNAERVQKLLDCCFEFAPFVEEPRQQEEVEVPLPTNEVHTPGEAHTPAQAETPAAITNDQELQSTIANFRNELSNYMMNNSYHMDEEEEEVKSQKRYSSPIRERKLTKEQMERFNMFDMMYARLVEYYQIHGHCDVTSEHELSSSVVAIRRNYNVVKRNEAILDYRQHKFTILTPQRIQKLRAIDFSFQSKLEKEQQQRFENFDAMFDKLVAYNRVHGSVEVNSNEDKELAKWISDLRRSYTIYKRNQKYADKNQHTFTLFTPEREKRLLDLGVDFSSKKKRQKLGKRKDPVVQNEKWEAMYESLKQYKLEYGTCQPKAREGTSTLHKWMKDQREAYANVREGKDSILTIQRIQKLNDIGFQWVKDRKINRSFDERLAELIAFKEEHGHTIVPRPHPGGLGKWCAEQRHKHKHLIKGDGSIYTLSQEKADKLNAIGFTWEVIKSPSHRVQKKSWEERYQDLVQFRQDHGHTIVPQDYPGLGGWVKKQRAAYREMKRGIKSDMTQEKALRLAEVGFAWEVQNRSPRNATAGLLQSESRNLESNASNQAYESEDSDSAMYANLRNHVARQDLYRI